MFNLERAIAKWREQMISAGFRSSLTLDELESHLRDEINAQLDKGFSDEQAFDAAVRQIGQAAPLRKEFNKTASKSELEYKIGKVLVLIGFAIYALFSIKCIYFSSVVDAPAAEKAIGALAVVFTFVCALVSTNLWRVMPVIINKSKRVALGVGAIAVGIAAAVVIFNVVMPRLELNVAEVVFATLWGMVPLVIGGTVAGAIFEAADRRLCLGGGSGASQM
jgi:hypothetical protein